MVRYGGACGGGGGWCASHCRAAGCGKQQRHTPGAVTLQPLPLPADLPLDLPAAVLRAPIELNFALARGLTDAAATALEAPAVAADKVGQGEGPGACVRSGFARWQEPCCGDVACGEGDRGLGLSARASAGAG